MKKQAACLLSALFLAPVWLAGQAVFLRQTAHLGTQVSAPRAEGFAKGQAAVLGWGEPLPVSFLLKKPVLPPAFCAADLAFFCRLELKMDRALRTPVHFRLGTQEYVDWLERKSAARFMDFRR